jgi:hypothetical protein
MGNRPLDGFSLTSLAIDVCAAWKEGWQGSAYQLSHWFRRRQHAIQHETLASSCHNHFLCSLMQRLALEDPDSKDTKGKIANTREPEEPIDWRSDFKQFKTNLFAFSQAVGVLGLLKSDMPCDMITRLQERAQHQMSNISEKLALNVLKHQTTIRSLEVSIKALWTRRIIEQLMFKLAQHPKCLSSIASRSAAESAVHRLKGKSKQPPSEEGETNYRVVLKSGVSGAWVDFWNAMWQNAAHNTANPFYKLRQEAKSIDYEESRVEIQGRSLFKDTCAIIHGFKTFQVQKPDGDEIFERFGKPTTVVSGSFSTQAQHILNVLNPRAYGGNEYDDVNWDSEVNRYVDCLVLAPATEDVDGATGSSGESASSSKGAASKGSTSKGSGSQNPTKQSASKKLVSHDAPKVKAVLSTKQVADLFDTIESDEAIFSNLFIQPGHNLG